LDKANKNGKATQHDKVVEKSADTTSVQQTTHRIDVYNQARMEMKHI